MFRHSRFGMRKALGAALLTAFGGVGVAPPPAYAQFYSFSGSVGTAPTNFFPIDVSVASHDFTGHSLLVGNGAVGSFSALSGAQMRLDALNIGLGGTGDGTVAVTGPNAKLELGGAPARLVVGTWGTGSLTVSAGGVIDATLNAGACTAGDCYNFVGLGAGSTGSLTVTGVGSEVRTLRGFQVGQASVIPGLGTPGGTTNATVSVLNGGTLRTEFAVLGTPPLGPNVLGTERTNATVTIDGAGSKWIVTRNSIDNEGPYLYAARHANATVNMTVSNGGKLVVDGVGSTGNDNGIILGQDGGHASLTVTGAGSLVRSVGGGVPFIGAGFAGQGSFSVLAGATAEAMIFVAGEHAGSHGELLIDGVGSQLTLSGVARLPGPNSEVGAFALGDDSGSFGQGIVRNGGRLLATDGGADSRGTGARPAGWVGGTEAGVTRGVLRIEGAGSAVEIVGNTLGLAPGVPDNINPVVGVGAYAGNQGELFVTGGGRLQLTGHAVSTVADTRPTLLTIGGRDDLAPGGTGSALVSGAGSEIRVVGSDGFIVVGRKGNGSLTIQDQGRVESAVMNVGRGVGSNGTLVLDNARLDLSGQWTGSTVPGAALTLGNRGGTGTAAISNGSVVEITNFGAKGATLSLGGTAENPLGHGVLTLSGGSRISLSAAAGLATLSVGHDGSGVLSMDGHSSIDLSDGNTFLGRLATGSGTVVMSQSSTLRSGYVGVGSTPGIDTGVGSLMVGSGSAVTAQTVEVGTRGLLGGSNGTINGTVIVRGTLAPGESPGRLTINGGLQMQSPGRMVLEVQADGHGGFITDQVVLTKGSVFDLSAAAIEFHFLGDTDPAAFLATGLFDMDTFLRWLDGTVESGLSAAFAPGDDWGDVLANAQFRAFSDHWTVSALDLRADGGFAASIQAVPEPSTWALLLAAFTGFWLISVARRRRGSG